MSKLAWGSDKANKILNKKIDKFISTDIKDGVFSKRLYKYLGISLDEYNQLIHSIK